MAQGLLRGQVLTLRKRWCQHRHDESATLLKHSKSINCDTYKKVRHSKCDKSKCAFLRCNMYGPFQCVLKYPGNFINLLSYKSTRSPVWKCFFLMCWSCHAFSLAFYTCCWNPTINLSSSSSSIFDSFSFNIAGSSIFVKVEILRLGTIYSIGMTTSCPYTNLKGVWPINFLQVVL